jgi:hypothetical protein
MQPVSLRELDSTEKAHVADVLRRLREHYKEWCRPGSEGYEHHLVAFAYYEGCARRDECCRAILGEAAPFALGTELVARYGFRWVMISAGDSWRYAVEHPALPEPIDLLSLEDGSWNEKEYSPGCEPEPGATTHDSFETILARTGQSAPED